MNKLHALIAGIVLSLIIVGILNIPWCHTIRKVERTYNSIYHVTAPFGIYWTEGDGSIQGSFLYKEGSYEMQMVENYIVKYFDGNELKTIILNAENTSIVVDETFRLETITYREYYYRDKDNVYMDYYVEHGMTYKIHLPFLPNLNSTFGDE